MLKWLQRRTGHPLLASRHLTEAVCEGEVPVSCTNIFTGERKHVLPKYFLDICMVGGTLEPRFDFEKGRDWEFSVWGPKFAKRWPEWERTADDHGDASRTERRKPGPQPKHDWPTVVARELIRRAKAGGKEPTASQLAQFCQDKLNWQPDISALQRLLKQLL